MINLNGKIKEAFVNTFKLAVDSLNTFVTNPSLELDAAVYSLMDCNRLIVTTGVGKSGFIAQKMAATLTSTGSSAVFLDPLNALHGDLGITAPGDVVIAFSYSGETAEILAILPTLKQRGVPVISIVGNLQSSLGKASAVVLHAPVAREACPLNLAPTTSTLVAMAVADALAVALMTAKNYRAEDFALNHPAGSLGRRLTLKVSDLLVDSALPLHIAPDASFSDIVCAISANGAGAVCIVDLNMQVLGIITDGDIRRTVQNFSVEALPKIQARQIMTKNPIAVTSDTLAIEALNQMEQRRSQISVLPVIDNLSRFQGIIRLHDLIRAGL